MCYFWILLLSIYPAICTGPAYFIITIYDTVISSEAGDKVFEPGKIRETSRNKKLLAKKL